MMKTTTLEATTIIVLVIMATLPLNVVGDCMQSCHVNRELCFNNVEMNRWSEQFMCIKQHGICLKECALLGRKRGYREDSTKTIYHRQINDKTLRKLYREMPKELLVELLIKTKTNAWYEKSENTIQEHNKQQTKKQTLFK